VKGGKGDDKQAAGAGCKAQCRKCDIACVVIIARGYACERLKLNNKMTTWRDKVIVIVWISPNRVC
jgi:hypothetical protein